MTKQTRLTLRQWVQHYDLLRTYRSIEPGGGKANPHWAEWKALDPGPMQPFPWWSLLGWCWSIAALAVALYILGGMVYRVMQP